MLDLRYYDTGVWSSFNKSAKAYITEDTIRWRKSGRWKTGTNTEMSRAFCQNDVWVVSLPKWWDEWENTDWQRNRRWSETERRVNHPGCHLFLCSPVRLKLFSLISDYRRQSWILSKMQPQMERKNVFAVWNSEALSSFEFKETLYIFGQFWSDIFPCTHNTAAEFTRSLNLVQSVCLTAE